MENPNFQTVNIWGNVKFYSCLQEAFKFCWSSFTKNTKPYHNQPGDNIKSNKFNLHLETDNCQINYVNTNNLGHQYGISVGEAQKLNIPSDKKQGDTVVFAGYYLKASDRIAS